MNKKHEKKWFTVARFENGMSTDAENRFRTLASCGFTPMWSEEPSNNPLHPIAVVIKIPLVEKNRYLGTPDGEQPESGWNAAQFDADLAESDE